MPETGLISICKLLREPEIRDVFLWFAAKDLYGIIVRFAVRPTIVY